MANKLHSSKNVIQNSKKLFSYRQVKPPTPGGYAAMALIGAGAAGLGYLMLYGRNLSYSRVQYAPYGVQQKAYFDPIVQQRIR